MPLSMEGRIKICHKPGKNRPRRHIGMLLFTLLQLNSAALYAACGGWTEADSQATLDAAIASFNAQASPCEFGIRLTGDVLLSASTTGADNSVVGVVLTVDGQGYAIDGQDNSGVRPFWVNTGTDVLLENLIIRNGNVVGGMLAGGIYNAGTLTLVNSTVANNKADASGGIHNNNALTIIGSNFYDNTTEAIGGNGGGITNASGSTLTVTSSTFLSNDARRGGAIYNSTGTVTVQDSTFGTNSAFYDGAGLYNSGTMKIINSTMSGNTSQQVGGGGVFNSGAGTLTVINSTFKDNSGSGIVNSGTMDLHNSVFQNNSGPGDCYNYFSTSTVQFSQFEDTGVTACNLAEANPDAAGNIVGISPLLGPLQSNGGPTETHALDTHSLAIDAGDNSLAVDADATPLNYDQRGAGFPRVRGSAVDMGAYEIPPYFFADGFED